MVANGFVSLFAAMVVAEHVGLLPPYQTPALVASPRFTAGSVVIMTLCLNLAAYFISAIRGLLESRTMELWDAKQTLQIHSEALELSNEKLKERSTELRNLIYGVTHDLKNPFNSILLTARLLLRRDGGALGPEGHADLELIARTAAHGENMLRDLLGLFQVTSVPEALRAVPLDALVRKSLETLRPQMVERGEQVRVMLLPQAWGQPGKLSHVVSNLLCNAVRYAPPGRGEVLVTGSREDGRVTLEVCDNGVGIPPAYHRRIFELFGRVPSNGWPGDCESPTGTGVGLAIVKRIVEEHRGRVWVESAPGTGSRFVVELPAVPDTHG